MKIRKVGTNIRRHQGLAIAWAYLPQDLPLPEAVDELPNPISIIHPQPLGESRDMNFSPTPYL